MRTHSMVLGLLALMFAVPAAAAQISVSTGLSNPVLYAGENRTYAMTVMADENRTDLTVEVTGGLQEMVQVQRGGSQGSTTRFDILLNAPDVSEERTFTGAIVVSSQTDMEQLPLAVRVIPANQTSVSLTVQFLSERVQVSERPQLNTRVSRDGPKQLNLSVVFQIKRSSDGSTVYTTEREFYLNRSSVSRVVELPSLEGNVSTGSYYVQSFIIYEDDVYTSLDTVQFVKPFWTPLKVRAATFIIVALAIAIGGWRARKWYLEKRQEESRYVFPVDYEKLPEEEDSYWVGKVAETTKQAYVDPDDLTTHAIVAGSTGAGKSVSASVIVEEALENDVPVVVFDPTAQWTGFVKKCIDDNLLEHYDRFDMDEEDDPHPYKGLIKKIDAEDPDIDFEKLMNPGEVTVFTLDHLSTEEFDTIVRKIIDSIFEVEWEESSELEMLVVFDEVHRLLEKYGGKGGYNALERGAREFRKWGIGLVMASQVTADFKQAVSGNIMTEVQMQTKSMEDIDRIEKKYGDQFAKRISSEEVGTGMIQNPEYNDGDPWFVDFRPTYHNPHKIPDEELEQYHEYTRRADRLAAHIDQMEEDGEDVYDERLELQLATDKLKEGRFQMAEIYIDSLEEKLGLQSD